MIRIHSIYDNGGATFDRYTVYLRGSDCTYIGAGGARLRWCLCMSENALGYCQHGSGQPGAHNGRRITLAELPPACRAVLERMGYAPKG